MSLLNLYKANKKTMIRIDSSLLDAVVEKAKSATRQRMNFNFHDHPSARVQRMLNAMEPGTYIRPHKHENPDKLEVFLCLKGSFAVIVFDSEGHLTDIEILDPGKGRYGVEIAPGTWHSLIALRPGSVAYEVKDGPYDPADDKQFAMWAPNENTPEALEWVSRLTATIVALRTIHEEKEPENQEKNIANKKANS